MYSPFVTSNKQGRGIASDLAGAAVVVMRAAFVGLMLVVKTPKMPIKLARWRNGMVINMLSM
jgi:hypothetical protein